VCIYVLYLGRLDDASIFGSHFSKGRVDVFSPVIHSTFVERFACCKSSSVASHPNLLLLACIGRLYLLHKEKKD